MSTQQADVEGASVDQATGQTVHTEGRTDTERATKAYAGLKAIVNDLTALLTKAQEGLDEMDRVEAETNGKSTTYGGAARNAKSK